MRFQFFLTSLIFLYAPETCSVSAKALSYLSVSACTINSLEKTAWQKIDSSKFYLKSDLTIQASIAVIQAETICSALIKNHRNKQPKTPLPANLQKLQTSCRLQKIDCYRKQLNSHGVIKTIKEILGDASTVIQDSLRKNLLFELSDCQVACGDFADVSQTILQLNKNYCAKGRDKSNTFDYERLLFIYCELFNRVGAYEVALRLALHILREFKNPDIKLQANLLVARWVENNFSNDLNGASIIKQIWETMNCFGNDGPFHSKIIDVLLFKLYFHASLIQPSGNIKYFANRMAEYYCRKMGENTFADSAFKRSVGVIYHPYLNESLPHFLYAYSKILSVTPLNGNIDSLIGQKDQFFSDLFKKYCDPVFDSTFLEKVSSTCISLLVQNVNDYELLFSAFREKEERRLTDLFIVGSDGELRPAHGWLTSPYRTVISIAQKAGYFQEAFNFSIQLAHHLKKFRKISTILSGKPGYSYPRQNDTFAIKELREIYGKAIDLNESIAGSLATSFLKRDFYRENLSTAHSELVSLLIELGNYKQAVYHVECAKSRSLLADISYNALVNTSNSLNKTSFPRNISDIFFKSTVNKDLSDTSLLSYCHELMGIFAQGNHQNIQLPEIDSVSTVQNRLNDNDVVLQQFLDDDLIVTFLISRDSLKIFKSESNSQTIINRVLHLCKKIIG
jgi:hypothetical protein